MLNKKIQFIITTVIFSSFLAGFAVVNLVRPVKKFSEVENRLLAQLPKLNVETVLDGSFTKDFEEFYSDQFVFRNQFMTLKTIMDKFSLRKDSNGVYFGKDDYLIEQHKEQDIDKEQLEKNTSRLLEMLEKYSESLGAERVKAILVPTADQILIDKLPAYAAVYDQNPILDQILEKSKANNIIDIRTKFQALQEEYIYYRTDHHWTGLGAYYAYQECAKQLGFEPYQKEEFELEIATKNFLGTLHSKVNIPTKADSITLYHLKKELDYKVNYNLGEKTGNSLYDYSKLDTKDKYAVYLGGNNAVVEIDTNIKNGRKLLVVKDSYAHCFVPLLANHYEKTVMLDFRYFNMGIEELIKQYEITDILVLYNTMNFAKDTNTLQLLK